MPKTPKETVQARRTRIQEEHSSWTPDQHRAACLHYHRATEGRRVYRHTSLLDMYNYHDWMVTATAAPDEGSREIARNSALYCLGLALGSLKPPLRSEEAPLQ